jgi:nitrate reductase (NAD(P)H)
MHTPDFKLLDPQHHAFARFALPYTEDQIKGQEWKGKHDKEKEEKESGGKCVKKEKGGDSKNGSGEEKFSNSSKDAPNQEDTKGDSNDNESKGDLQDVTSDQDDSKKGPQGNNSSSDDSSPEDRAFANALIEEMQAIRNFSNATGQPSGSLKGLDKNAYLQLESRISVDDQVSPRTSKQNGY